MFSKVRSTLRFPSPVNVFGYPESHPGLRRLQSIVEIIDIDFKKLAIRDRR